MEGLLWSLKTLDPLLLATPIFLNLAVAFLVTQSDFLFLLAAAFGRVAFGAREPFRPLGPGERPTGLVIIPSLLRDGDDLKAITTTIESAATNGYPSELVIVASVDGRTEFPKLYGELEKWTKEAKGRYPKNVHVYVTGTPTRLGKMMAVEAGVSYMKERVKKGDHAEFPKIYFSIDGDGTLGDHAIERLANRLTSRNPWTGEMRRVVAGKICIRPDLFWQGWGKFFTVEGQLYMQAAREFVVSNVSRYNWKITPRIGIPGALYCTWTELLLAAPKYMGFMHSLGPMDLVKWWMGMGGPKFSESTAEEIPEALTGASDDTCMAFLASLSSWKGEHLDFDVPATPLHAFGRFLASYTYNRSHDYEPEARVFTYTPPTLKGLWKQRVRWNSSRVECAGRFWRAFWFHWEIGLPVSAHLLLLLNTVFEIVGYYIILPYYLAGESNALLGYVLGYTAQTVAYGLYTVLALMLEKDRARYWRVLMCLPLASLYAICINAFGCVYGVTRDILLFGNATNFAPEWTLAKGGCERIALMFRVRRFLALAARSVVYGDVPFGKFWFGWTETPWTPSGFEGWTTGKKPRAIFPMPSVSELTAKLGWSKPETTEGTLAEEALAAESGTMTMSVQPAAVEAGASTVAEPGAELVTTSAGVVAEAPTVSVHSAPVVAEAAPVSVHSAPVVAEAAPEVEAAPLSVRSAWAAREVVAQHADEALPSNVTSIGAGPSSTREPELEAAPPSAPASRRKPSLVPLRPSQAPPPGEKKAA